MADIEGRARVSLAALLGKHQLASAVTTAIDFAAMIVLVSVVGISAEAGTACGAGTGAVVNFTIGRHFTFRATGGAAHGQAVRYALVSAASLGLNTLGVHLIILVVAPHFYVVARAVTATLVSFLWNFPMHRYFVFRVTR
jgi:putative flippase GtrA